jgi:integrase
MLSTEGAAFFSRMCKGKLPGALIFSNAGEAWNHNTWGQAMRDTLAAHHAKCRSDERLPEGTSAYAFRHTRISELLQIHGIDPLTVAMQTGTSLHQIEKTYYKFISTALQEKLAAVRETA